MVAALTANQLAQVVLAERAMASMLREQDITAQADATLNAAIFTTTADAFGGMIEQVDTDYEFSRLVASLVADVGRAAESVAITTRPRIGWTRYLSPPSCARCVVLSGRFYRWSDGFKRHPGCDCVHVPTTESAASDLVSDPSDLFEQGKVTGLSKAEQQAIRDGADLNQVINAHRDGLTTSELFGRKVRTTSEGTTKRGLYGSSDFAAGAGFRSENVGRRGAVANYTQRTTNRARLSVGEIYKQSRGDRDEAMRLLGLYGYVR